MPKEELAIERVFLIVTSGTRAKLHSPRISRFTGTTELLTIPSELLLSQNTIFRILEITVNLFYIRISTISKRLYLIELCLFDPQRTFGNPLRTLRQSFANRVLKIEILPTTAKFSSLYAGTSSVQNPAGTMISFS